MRTAIITIAACAFITSAHAATEKALSPSTGHSPALVTTTTIRSTDSPLVRAAKLTVAARLHGAGANVWVINDAMVQHTPRDLGEAAPSYSGGTGSPGAAGAGATASAVSAPGAAASAQKVEGLRQEQRMMAHEAEQPSGDNVDVDYAQKRLQEIPRDIRAAQSPAAPPPPQEPQ